MPMSAVNTTKVSASKYVNCYKLKVMRLLPQRGSGESGANLVGIESDKTTAHLEFGGAKMGNKEPKTPVLSDDALSSQSPPDPPKNFVRPTVAESLTRDIADKNADFYIIDGRPIVVWTDLDLAFDYSTDPIREISAFVIFGERDNKVDADMFSKKVKEIHRL